MNSNNAVNIAESAVALAKHKRKESLLKLPEMEELAQKMLQNALDGFIHSDASPDMLVLVNDDTMDALNCEVTQSIIKRMKNEPERIKGSIGIIRINRNLERVADIATNIAVEVIFIAQARVVKHHAKEKNNIAK